ncbi:MAG: EamA family transporter [Vicingaceae bacterium]
MIYLLLSIFCSTSIFIVFRSFDRFKIDTFSAIVVNYLVAGSIGFLISDVDFSMDTMLQSSWSINGLILGVLFITLFYIMATTAQKLGASVASIANKMALVVPVLFAIFYYGDSYNFLKIMGVLMALVGIYLSTVKPKVEKKKFDWKLFFIPFILFLGSGFIDTFIKYTQEFHLQENQNDSKLFSSLIFATAFCIGILITFFRKGKGLNHLPTWVGGVVLGLINYGSIYFLILTFNNSSLESSVVFPINNMGVVIFTTLLSFFLFQERFSNKNKVGVALSVLSILLISLS